MNCFSVRRYLEKMVAGEIKGSLERQLLEHLQSCSGCRGEYQEMKQVLEMNQEPVSGEILRFNPVWRQRIRQDAFERETGRRGFFAVFKANTFIPALGVLAVLIVFGVFNTFNHFTPKVTIEPMITRYSPGMSSTIGIPLTAKIIDDRGPKEIAYHWSTEYGQFLFWDDSLTELGPEVWTRANKVYWSVALEEEREVSSFTICLRVADLKTGKIFSRAELRLKRDGEEFYITQEQ